ncbi:MAG: HAMP domain-containing histidine kinase [Acidimicrobiaceae bacterium]|nr:HAMP domain-containing histidine kinase [Acidimicrobiaceae bacterium]
MLATAWRGPRCGPSSGIEAGQLVITAGAAGVRLEVPPLRDDEVTRLGHTLNDMLSALEQALDRERQFVNEASHELRTPITLLTSRIQLARRRPRTQEEHERILDDLDVDLGRLARLADELLTLGATDTGAGHGDLAATAARLIEQRQRLDPRAAQIRIETAADTMPVAANDAAIERILTNLLDNAASHGLPPYPVTLDTPVAGWGRLTVADNGPGMPPALLNTATRRFARAEEARSRPGAGLGLALVQAIVSDTGGELRLCHQGNHTSSGATAPAPVPTAPR